MIETIRIALFTLVGISAIFSVIIEFQKPEKKFLDYIRNFNSDRGSLDVNRTSRVTYIISTPLWIKLNIPSILYMTLDFLLVPPWRTEQLAFASCSFLIHRHIMMKWSYIISKQKTLIYFLTSHFSLKEHFLKVLF